MAVQNLIDRYSSTLSGAYTSGGTTLSVTSASGLPSGACSFLLIVKAEGANTEEVCVCTNVSGTTLTVAGAQANSSASNHASGATIVGGIVSSSVIKQTGWVLLEEHTASTSAALNFTTGITSDFDEYAIEIIEIVTATDNASITVQVSTDGGANYDATSGHYAWQAWAMVSGGSGSNGSTSDTKITLIVSQTSGTNNTNFSGFYRLYNPGGASRKIITGVGTGWDSSGTRLISYTAGGSYLQTTAVNAFRIIASSGNLTSGTVRLFGVAK